MASGWDLGCMRRAIEPERSPYGCCGSGFWEILRRKDWSGSRTSEFLDGLDAVKRRKRNQNDP